MEDHDGLGWVRMELSQTSPGGKTPPSEGRILLTGIGAVGNRVSAHA